MRHSPIAMIRGPHTGDRISGASSGVVGKGTMPTRQSPGMPKYRFAGGAIAIYLARSGEAGPEAPEGKRMVRYIFLLPLLGILAGCPVVQPQDTPVPERHLVESRTQRPYWLYVPSYYSEDRTWPLVVTLHGTHGWDSSRAQIMDWKALAEEHGFIVAAPSLRSVQGILPVAKGLWYKDLAADEEVILATVDELAAKYRVDPKAVLLTGFSAGGYPLYYVGLRNPRRFDMLIARACNSRIDLFEKIELTDEARKLPILIFWGKDDLGPLKDQSWQAFRYLRLHGFAGAEKKKVEGGHLRRSTMAYQYWQKNRKGRLRDRRGRKKE